MRRCIDSLLSQTFHDFELILVDDGSTDGSSEICDEYGNLNNKGRGGKDKKQNFDWQAVNGLNNDVERVVCDKSAAPVRSVKVIHQPNAGVSTARNRGIESAQGDYISFVDADDWVEPRFLQVFVDAITKSKAEDGNGADIVMQGYMNFEKERLSMPDAIYRDRKDFGAPLFEAKEKQLLGSVCTNVYRTQTIRRYGVTFDTEIRCGEDTIFNMRFFSHANCIAFSSAALYHYVDTGSKPYLIDVESQMKRMKAYATIDTSYLSEKEKQQFLTKEFEKSLYVVRGIYHDRFDRRTRLIFLEETRQRGKGNRELRLSDYPMGKRMLALLILHCPLKVADQLLLVIRHIRQTKRKFSFRR